MKLEILYRDNSLIAINKPHGLLVHKTGLAADSHEFALQILRDQIGQMVFPVHRLDRKTGGVLLFSLNQEMLVKTKALFENREIEKKYLAIVRGFTPLSGIIEYPLKNDKGKIQEAKTEFKTLEMVEIPLAFGKYQTQRYSLVEVTPYHGRMHQIRKHFAHIMHPIIGDRPHGCNKQNKLFKDKWKMETMMLHAGELKFKNPESEKDVKISARPGEEFFRTLDLLNFKHPVF